MNTKRTQNKCNETYTISLNRTQANHPKTRLHVTTKHRVVCRLCPIAAVSNHCIQLETPVCNRQQEVNNAISLTGKTSVGFWSARIKLKICVVGPMFCHSISYHTLMSRLLLNALGNVGNGCKSHEQRAKST